MTTPNQLAPQFRLLTQDEVAVMLGISPHTLRGWRSRKTGPPFVRVGGVCRYRVADIEAWIAAGVTRQPDVAEDAPSRERTPDKAPKGAGKSGAGSIPPNTHSEPTANAPQRAGASEDVTV